ncbi:unnamed protein product [Vitrella brassicaformis CCMP3155]|uniref:Uncharacterized protein n=1 Tax=Vitrella brassicaformis (strain CCMP3155) TaxID=1169540 RepID=A0A0G4EUC7_VITBC|nr:unnamed protein product [Vitrella brassicaformis CCMP3155]|eukprot:CEM02028.1 unnamed protein product [Vitrella brassicaformis CCMP3155]
MKPVESLVLPFIEVVEEPIEHLLQLDRIVVGITLEGEGWEGVLGSDIATALQEHRTPHPDPADGRRLPFYVWLRESGFEMVELPRLAFDCRVEVHRIGFVDEPMQRRITDYFSASHSQ